MRTRRLRWKTILFLTLLCTAILAIGFGSYFLGLQHGLRVYAAKVQGGVFDTESHGGPRSERAEHDS